MSAEQLSRDEVVAFLCGQPGTPEDLEPRACGPGLAPWARHHCYELHIGFTHLGWNIWTGNQADLAATARRLAEILERSPLPLASAGPSAET